MNKHMYILADGGRIAASDPSEFVRLLREGSWFDSECTDEEYMVNFSGRYHELHGGEGEDRHAREFHGRPEKVRLHQGLSGPLLYYYTPCRFEVTPFHFRWGFFLFHRRDAPVLRVSKGGRESRLATESFSAPYDKKRLFMTIPASRTNVLVPHVFFPYIRTDI